MPSLFEQLTWQHHPVGSGSAHSTVNLSVGTLGDANPLALITAGVHGDEGPWGALAIRKLLQNTPSTALSGTLRIVTVANPLAMQADARNAPLDTLDLNRSFPGNVNGSHTERLAATLTTQALEGAEVVIDLHGGGSWCVNAFAFEMPGGEDLTAAFGAPFTVSAPDRTVTLTGYAKSRGARVVAVEMGGRSALEDAWAGRIANGLRRALITAGVLDAEIINPAGKSIPVGDTTVLRPSRGGVFIPGLREEAVGTIVPHDTLLGTLIDPVTQAVIEHYRAPFAQTALLLLRPHIYQLEGGAMTYVVAEPE